MISVELIVAWRCHMASWTFISIGLGNSLLPYGTKLLPKKVLINHQLGPVQIY